MECEILKSTATHQGQQFFATGLEKYLDAKSAVTMFEKEVQWRVKEVVTKHQTELAKLFGEDWVLKDYFESGMPDHDAGAPYFPTETEPKGAFLACAAFTPSRLILQ